MSQDTLALPKVNDGVRARGETAWAEAERRATAEPGVKFSVWKLARGFQVVREGDPEPEGDEQGGVTVPLHPPRTYTEFNTQTGRRRDVVY